jgi:hypothetical protein
MNLIFLMRIDEKNRIKFIKAEGKRQLKDKPT